MSRDLTPEQAVEMIVNGNAKTFRGVLRKMRSNNVLDSKRAWQTPEQANGRWTIREDYVREIAQERGWALRA